VHRCELVTEQCSLGALSQRTTVPARRESSLPLTP
jgi:hypothetical protein